MSPSSKLRRSTRSRLTKEERREEEMNKIISYLNITDDSNHGIEISDIENKGRGVKVGFIFFSQS